MARFNVHQFGKFVEDAQGGVAALYKEIAEVQEALNDAREAARLQRRDLVDQARLMVRAKRAALDAGFMQTWDTQVDEQRKSLQAEAAALKELVAKGEADSDQLLTKGTKVRERLKSLNPELDAQEEALKKEVADLDRQASDLDAQIARLARWFGMITRRGHIKDLGKQLGRTDEKLAAAQKALADVRERWRTEAAGAKQEEDSFEGEWETLELRVARLRQDLSTIEVDLDGEAERRALFGMVQGEAEPPRSGDADVDKLLAKVDDISDNVLDEQEKALTTGAEMLGMLSGLGQGLDGFRKSLQSVIDEQDGHSELPTLQIDVSDPVVQFHSGWAELRDYVINERQMAAYPTQFCQALRPVLDQRMTPEGIERMFTEMGDALSAATARWGA